MSREVVRITPTWVWGRGLGPDEGRQVRWKAAKASGNNRSARLGSAT